VFKRLCLPIVIQSEVEQAASKFSFEYPTGKLPKSGCLSSERLAAFLDLPTTIVGHGIPR
jgi:hypothetical protein